MTAEEADPQRLVPLADDLRSMARGCALGSAAALAVFVAAGLYDMPLLGAGATGVLVPLMVLAERPRRAWEREHAVVLWRPALGSRPYADSPLYSTPVEPAAAGD